MDEKNPCCIAITLAIQVGIMAFGSGLWGYQHEFLH